LELELTKMQSSTVTQWVRAQRTSHTWILKIQFLRVQAVVIQLGAALALMTKALKAQRLKDQLYKAQRMKPWP
jgi:hypothetical protein